MLLSRRRALLTTGMTLSAGAVALLGGRDALAAGKALGDGEPGAARAQCGDFRARFAAPGVMILHVVSPRCDGGPRPIRGAAGAQCARVQVLPGRVASRSQAISSVRSLSSLIPA